MKFTPFKVAMGLSLLIHGAVFSVVYGLRYEPTGVPMRFNTERSLTIEMINEPASEAASLPASAVAKTAEISKPVPPPLPLPNRLESRTTTATLVQPVAPEKSMLTQVTRPVLAPAAEPANKIASATIPAEAVSLPGLARAVDVGANYLLNPPPDYPVEALRRKEEGLVILMVQVSQEGMPSQIQVMQSSKFSALDEAAVRAVAQWHFTPAKRGNLAVSSQIQMPIRFKLDGPK